MKSQSRNFIILVIVLAALAAGYFFLVRYNERQEQQESEQPEGETLVNIDRDDILRFSYVYDGVTYGFEKTEDGTWASDTDPSLNLIQSRLNTMAGKFIYLSAKNTFTDVTDMSQYGLDDPANVLHWETAQGDYTYCVGDYNSMGSVYYICEPDSSTVYAVTASLGTGFSYSLEDLVEQEADETQE